MKERERERGCGGRKEGEMKGDSEAGSGRTGGWGKAVPEVLFLCWSAERKERTFCS